MKELYFIMLKKMLESKSLKKEQIDYILFMLDENIQEHYKEKMLVLENQLKEKDVNIVELTKRNNELEIENDGLRKKMDVVVETNQVLLRQLEQRDETTLKTLDAIKTNIQAGNHIIKGIQQMNDESQLRLESNHQATQYQLESKDTMVKENKKAKPLVQVGGVVLENADKKEKNKQIKDVINVEDINYIDSNDKEKNR